MSTSLVRSVEPTSIAHETAYEPRNGDEAYKMAQTLVKSGLLPRSIQTAEAAFTIIVTGKELGLTVMQSLRSVHVIEGKPTLSSDLILALVKRSPVCASFQLITSTDKVATYRTERKGEARVEMSFTIEQAQRAGVTGKDNWRKYPEAMLRARCIAALARAVYPDVVLGIYETSELDSLPAAADSRNVVDAELCDPAQAPSPTEAANLIRSLFTSAKNTEQLDKAVAETKRAHAANEITGDERAEMVSLNKKMRKQLAQEVAPATDAAPPASQPAGNEAAQ